VGRLGHPLLIVPDCVVEHGVEFFAGIVRHRLEGMMAKRIDSPYLIGKRSSDWLKIKVLAGVPGVALVQRSPQIKPSKVGDRR